MQIQRKLVLLLLFLGGMDAYSYDEELTPESIFSPTEYKEKLSKKAFITPSPVDISSIENFWLIDATSDQVLFEIQDGATINIFDYPEGLNIQATVSEGGEQVGSVRFSLSGQVSYARTESKAPYALYGDSNGNYRPAFFKEGDYTLTATAYSEKGAKGIVSPPMSIQFTIIQQEEDPCKILPKLTIPTSSLIGCTEEFISVLAEASEPGSFLWKGPDEVKYSSANLTATLEGQYILTFTSLRGCEVTDTLTVSKVPLPVIQADVSNPIPCTGGTATLSLLAGEEGEIVWTGPNNFSSSLENPTITQAGTYIATFINEAGCTNSFSLEVPVANEPEIIINRGDGPGCSSEPVALIATSNTEGSFLWKGPQNFTAQTQSIIAEEEGTYEVTIMAQDGCQNSKEIEIVWANKPIVQAGKDVRLSCLTNTATLKAQTLEEGTFAWNGPGGFTSQQQEITVSQAGSYIVTFRNQRGCEDSDAVEVFPAIIPLINIAEEISIPCNEVGIGLIAETNTTGTFDWSGPDGASGIRSTLFVSQSGTYSVSFTTEDGCTVSENVKVVNEDYDPFVSMPESISLGCAGDSVLLQVGIGAHCGLSWSGPNDFMSTDFTPKVGEVGTYSLLVRNEAGCEASRSLVVTESGYDPVFSIPETVGINCSQGATQIAVEATNYDSVRWSGPNGYTSTELSPNVSLIGTYELTVFSGDDCFKVYEVEAELTGESFEPVSAIEPSVELGCESGTVTLSVAAAGYDSFSWAGPDGFSSEQLTPVVSTTGTYTITFTSGLYCEAFYQIEVNENQSYDPISSIPTEVSLGCAANELKIQVEASPFDSVRWVGPEGFTANELSPIVSQVGEYTLRLFYGPFCQVQKKVDVLPEAESYSPVTDIPTEVNLDCESGVVRIEVLASDYDSLRWAGPNGFSASTLVITPSVVGAYAVNFFKGENCTTGYVVSVSDCIPAPSCEFPAIADVLLIDADTDLGVISLTDGAIINLVDYPNPLNIDAIPENCPEVLVQSVSFSLSGPVSMSRTESVAPFALGGDSGGDFRPIAFETGSYTLTLTPYAEKGAKGTIGEVTEISFTVINQAFDPCEEGTPEIAVGNDWVLTCDQETIQLSATSSENGDFQWRGPNAFNKVGESVQVSAAGTYTLTFTNSSGCSVTDQLKVVKEEYSPILDLPTSVSLGCEENTTVIPLKVGSFAELEWIGPNGYSSGEIQPAVTEAGVYSLVVTNDKGCTATATSSVRFQAYDPAINVPSSYSLDCESESTPLNIQLDSYASLSWTGPDGFFSEEENIQVQEEGVYTLRVYSSGGCEAIYEVQLTPCVEVCTESAIDRIILVDAGSDKDMLEIQEGSTLVVGSQNGGFAIRAEEIACSFPVKSVRFSLSGKQNRTRTESKAPWAAFGDRNGDFSAWNAEPGSYTLQAIPYSEKGGKGQAGKAKEVSFTVIAAQTGIAQMSSQAGSSSSSFLDEPHMRIMPNPVADQAKLEVVGRRNGRINVAIFNLLGEVVLEADFDKSMDSQSFSLALSGLANGVYTAQVIYDRQLFSQKILVKK